LDLGRLAYLATANHPKQQMPQHLLLLHAATLSGRTTVAFILGMS